MLANDDDRQLDVCRELADRGVLFDVIFAATLPKDLTAAYHTIVADDVKYLSDEQLKMLADWVRGGGRLIATSQTGQYTDRFLPRGHNRLAAWFDRPNALPDNGEEVPLGQGSVRYFAHMADWPTVAKPLLEKQRAQLVDVEAPATVRFNLHGQRGSDAWLLHLLNYGPDPATNVKVTLPRQIAKVTLLSPDGEASQDLPITAAGSGSAFVVPKLTIYTLAIIQPGETVK